MPITNCDPKDVARWLSEHAIVLVDVREPQEYAVERIKGALLFPLSTFDPRALPDTAERKIVFHCGSGMRSSKAAAACRDAGIAHDLHMAGGLQAWKAAGLRTIGVDAVTGEVRER